jgi:hypothetical protein
MSMTGRKGNVRWYVVCVLFPFVVAELCVFLRQSSNSTVSPFREKNSEAIEIESV